MAQYLKDCGSVSEGLRSKTEVLMCFRNFVVDPEAGKKKIFLKQNKTRYCLGKYLQKLPSVLGNIIGTLGSSRPIFFSRTA